MIPETFSPRILFEPSQEYCSFASFSRVDRRKLRALAAAFVDSTGSLGGVSVMFKVDFADDEGQCDKPQQPTKKPDEFKESKLNIEGNSYQEKAPKAVAALVHWHPVDRPEAPVVFG